MSRLTFTHDQDQLSNTIVKYSFPYTQSQVIEWWSKPNVEWLCRLLLLLESSPFREYRLEVKPFQKDKINTTKFEFVLVKDFFTKTYQGQFDGYFEEGLDHGKEVVVFSGRNEPDVTLIVPTPEENFPSHPKKSYGSPQLKVTRQLEKQDMETIGPFVRAVHTEAWTDRVVKGSQSYQWRWIEIWMRVAEEIKKKLLVDNVVWLNTHGHGVAWLHLRVETKPRYITYAPYTHK